MSKQGILHTLLVIINSLLRRFGLVLHRAQTVDLQTRRATVAEGIVGALTTPGCISKRNQSECVVFSMDRAMQLDALIGSYVDNVANPASIHILYRATNKAHQTAYSDVFKVYAPSIASIVVQQDCETFREQLLGILDGIKSEKMFFLVDDDLFVEKFDLNDLVQLDTRYVIPSLRMGTNLTENYTIQQLQPLPPFSRLGGVYERAVESDVCISEANRDELLCWTWQQGVYDWAYPLSVDGHIFLTAEIIALAKHTEFHSPNSFEANLQRHNEFFKHRLGVCYRKSRMVNIPCNKVQTDNANIHGDIHQDELLAKWEHGLRIYYQSLYGMDNKSAHQEIALTFIERNKTE